MTENFDLDTGKNIVEALMQSEDNFEDNSNVAEEVVESEYVENVENTENEYSSEAVAEETGVFEGNMKVGGTSFEQPAEDETLNHAVVEKYANDLYTFEVPNNVAVLKKLIAKLPSGVTRQTGAQIIKQTMEALGISMKSVLQEAQQLQDQLSGSTKECQATISEYKRQIATLEEQVQSYKKQYNNLNELVSLFIQVDNV